MPGEEKVNVMHVAQWCCPFCAYDNEDKASLVPGDTVTCGTCRKEFEIEHVYAS